MSTWYLSYDGKQIGPFDLGGARTQATARPNGYAWREGFPEWVPIERVAELSGGVSPGVPLPPSASGPTNADEIDYKIIGSEMQFVEVELDPGESAIAEAGSMMFKHPAIKMDTVFGDGRQQGGGFFEKLVGAGKRLITGESLFITIFSNQGAGKYTIAFGAPYPGNIIPVDLRAMGGRLICQKDSFLCAARGVAIGIYLQKKIMTALFGGEGFIMQKLEGDGMAFLHAGGTITERQLAAGETLDVDTGCIVAFQEGVEMEIKQAGGIKSMLFGGEGLFFATLRGPGRVWLQSLPFSRLAGRIHAAAASWGGKEEGSALGSLGQLFQGDRS